jgi:cytochrome P450
MDAKLSDPSLWTSAAVSALVLMVCYKYYVNYYNYWARRGVKGKRPFFVFNELYGIIFRDRTRDLVDAVRRYGRVYGTFFLGQPRLVVADADVLRQICIKDFDAFQNHGGPRFANKYQNRFLVWLRDNEWKQVRSLMTPAFTSGKIKRMYKLLRVCAEDLVDNFKEQYIQARRAGKQAADVDLFATYSMYTMDGITSCCYSLHLARQKQTTAAFKLKRGSSGTRNSLIDDVNKVFQFSMKRMLASSVVPEAILKLVNFSMAPESGWRGLIKRLEKLIEQRRQAGREAHDDLIQMLVDARGDDDLELNELDQAENHHAGLTDEQLKRTQENLKQSSRGAAELKLTDLDILANCLLMLSAGLDTTRSSLSTITYYLAHHPDIQERLHDEVRKIAKFEETAMGKRLIFDYDDLTSCQYLDAVISEGLRMLTPATFTDRLAGRDYRIDKYGIDVPKGARVLLGFHAVHHDPDYWPEPDKFNPDRFMPGQREKIVPGSYAPFGLGPRHCIGMRFSLTETKLGLAKVLMNFKFEPAPGTKYPPGVKRGIGLVSIDNCMARVTLRDIDF